MVNIICSDGLPFGRLFIIDLVYIYISAGKESTCNAGDPDLIAGMEDTLEKG